MYYKVVTIRNRGIPVLESAIIGNETLDGNPAFVLRYEKGVKTVPRSGTSIFVFDNFFAAKEFCKFEECGQVWECEVENPKPCIYRSVSLQDNHMSEFWMSKSMCSFAMKNDHEHAVLCDSVTLTKLVYDVDGLN